MTPHLTALLEEAIANSDPDKILQLNQSSAYLALCDNRKLIERLCAVVREQSDQLDYLEDSRCTHIHPYSGDSMTSDIAKPTPPDAGGV